MKLMGLMCVKNEEWCIGTTLRAALMWCDEVVVVDNGSTDRTAMAVGTVSRDHPWRIHTSYWVPKKKVTIPNAHDGELREVEIPDEDALWPEMEMRQHSLLLGRKHGGTHFAMIDADEMLTANLVDRARADVLRLVPGQVMDYPMLAMRDLEHYQDDQTVWSHAMLSVAFMDMPGLSWSPDAMGYQFHQRCPRGVRANRFLPLYEKGQGGIMHLQFANRNRLLWKHRWYAMQEVVRWKSRKTPKQVNETYGEALKTPGMLTKAPEEWFWGYDMAGVDLEGWAWHEGECRRLADLFGKEAFAGLDLWGWNP